MLSCTSWNAIRAGTALTIRPIWRKQVLTLLGEHLLAQHEHYRLADDEHARLRNWLQELKKAKRQKVNDTRGGAGNSSIILSTERYVPSEGVLLHDPNQPEND